MYIRILLILTILSIAACKKEADTNMPTQSGSNTVYYKVNGAEHKITGTRGSLRSMGVESALHPYDSFMTISTINRDGYIYDDLYLYVHTLSPELNAPYNIHYISGRDHQSEYHLQDKRYHPDMDASYVKFTRFDENVIAGTFYFKSLPDSNGSTINLTDGWFDISRSNK